MGIDKARTIERGCVPIVTALVLGLLVSVSGCGDPSQEKLEDYLLELEFETPLESTREVEIGTYVISAAAHRQATMQQGEGTQWMQVRFRLLAVVSPKNESAVLEEIERHRGLIDDTVLTLCRSASLEELADTRWAILKSRLIDGLRPILGQDRLRQLLVIDNVCEAI